MTAGQVIDEMESRFTSLNPIPVERATIKRPEWEVLVKEREKMRSIIELWLPAFFPTLDASPDSADVR